MNSPLPEQIGRFAITKVLGQGGMGVVYLGRDPGTEREVAVKTVKADAPEDIKQRLRIEGKAGRLDHENIVTVYETGQWNGDVPYIAMQFIAGDSLDKLVASRSPLSLLEKLDTIRQVCDGLDYAHLNGVVHRDIKPGNVIRRNDGLVKIVDFGIARVQTSNTMTAMTGPLQVIGTLAYMAPERLRGERGDGRVDIFATGVLLYYVLTGEEPFTGEAQAVMHKLVSEPHPPLSQRLSGYPTALDQILDRALAKYPEDRYSTAQEFAADLAAVIDELNRGRIAGLLEDCKRLIDEGAFRPAAEKAQLILRIDPQNALARGFRRSAQRGLDQKAIEERLRELQAEAAEALGQRRYEDAIRALEEASRRSPGDASLTAQLEDVREKKRLQMLKDSLCSDAKMAQQSGDLTGAIQRYEKAVTFDPQDVSLQEELSALKRVVREQEERSRAERHIAQAKQQLASQRYTDAITILEELLRSKTAHPDLDGLYRQALEGRKSQDVQRRRDEVITQVRRLRLAGQYPDALAEIDQAPEEVRSDTMLLRLRRELERDAENSRLAEWVAETVDRVLNEALTSLDGASATLHEAMQKLPGEERFESLEADLLRRQREFSRQQRRAACMREAGQALQGGEPERSIQVVESYLVEFPADGEIDALMEDARQAIQAKRQRVQLAEYTAKARTLLDTGKFELAIEFLRPLVAETQNRGLATLLGRAEQEKAEADGRIRLVAKRVAELRNEGQLAEAIALIEGQPAGTLQSSLLQEVLVKLKEERQRQAIQEREREEERKLTEERQQEEAVRRSALDSAVSKMRALVADGDWQRAREPLETFGRVYGESEALQRTTAEFDRERATAADRRVSRAIEEAKAALVTADRQAARGALEQAAGSVPFASAKLVEEWRRLGSLPAAPVKIARTESLPALEEQKKSKLGIMVGAAAVVLVGAGLMLWHPWKQAPAANQSAAAKPAATQNQQTEKSPEATASQAPSTQAPQAQGPLVKQPQTPPGLQAAVPSSPLKQAPSQQPVPAGPQPTQQPPPQVAAALPPSVVAFGVEKATIQQGANTTLHWEVNNVDFVDIEPGVGKQYAKGSSIIIPAASTHYRLLAANGSVLRELDVAVVAPAPVAVAVTPPPPPAATRPVDTPAVKQAGPERAVLLSGVASFQGLINQALSKKEKECRQTLSAANAALLSSYCGTADRVELAERSCEVSASSEDSARLTCDEDLRYHIIGGENGSLPARISFQFSRVPGTASWRVTKWDRRS